MDIYNKVLTFQKKYPLTIVWRLKQHAKIIETHIDEDEEIKYIFAAQKNDHAFDFLNTNIVAVTNKRIMIATKRLLFGYFFTSITPDLYNDMQVIMGILWGKVIIDTVKEKVTLSNIQKEALPEIENNITEYIVNFIKKED